MCTLEMALNALKWSSFASSVSDNVLIGNRVGISRVIGILRIIAFHFWQGDCYCVDILSMISLVTSLESCGSFRYENT